MTPRFLLLFDRTLDSLSMSDTRASGPEADGIAGGEGADGAKLRSPFAELMSTADGGGMSSSGTRETTRDVKADDESSLPMVEAQPFSPGFHLPAFLQVLPRSGTEVAVAAAREPGLAAAVRRLPASTAVAEARSVEVPEVAIRLPSFLVETKVDAPVAPTTVTTTGRAAVSTTEGTGSDVAAPGTRPTTPPAATTASESSPLHQAMDVKELPRRAAPSKAVTGTAGDDAPVKPSATTVASFDAKSAAPSMSRPSVDAPAPRSTTPSAASTASESLPLHQAMDVKEPPRRVAPSQAVTGTVGDDAPVKATATTVASFDAKSADPSMARASVDAPAPGASAATAPPTAATAPPTASMRTATAVLESALRRSSAVTSLPGYPAVPSVTSSTPSGAAAPRIADPIAQGATQASMPGAVQALALHGARRQPVDAAADGRVDSGIRGDGAGRSPRAPVRLEPSVLASALHRPFESAAVRAETLDRGAVAGKSASGGVDTGQPMSVPFVVPPTDPMSPGVAAFIEGDRQSAATVLLRHPAGTEAWQDELSAQLSMLAERGEGTEAVMKLAPEELGQLEVRVEVRDGEATLHFGVTNAEARQAVEAAQSKLRDLFMSQGMYVSEFRVFNNLSGNSHPQSSDGRGARAASPTVTGADDDLEVVVRPRRTVGVVDLYA